MMRTPPNTLSLSPGGVLPGIGEDKQVFIGSGGWLSRVRRSPPKGHAHICRSSLKETSRYANR